MRTILARLSAAVLLGGLCVPATAQGCSSGTFWKRDVLPDAPVGLTAVSVVPGLCEGESAGVVFELPAGMPPQRITQVVAPWGAQGGVGGFQAQLDVLIYDGVQTGGPIPNMGNLVFQLSNSGSAMQVQSHALNTLDISAFDVTVGNTAVRRFAVCFRVDINAHPTGTCAGGYPANFFTDNPSFVFSCNTPVGRSLIEIQGQGWRDAALATVSGLPICPFAYNGTWAIRCCSEDAFPAYYTTIAPGCPSSAGTTQLLPTTLPRIGTTMLVVLNNLPYSVAMMCMDFGNVPIDVTPFGLTGCTLQTGLTFTYPVLGGGGTAVHSLPLVLDNSLLGLVLYQQAFVVDPPLNPFGGALSDAAELQIGI